MILSVMCTYAVRLKQKRYPPTEKMDLSGTTFMLHMMQDPLNPAKTGHFFLLTCVRMFDFPCSQVLVLHMTQGISDPCIFKWYKKYLVLLRLHVGGTATPGVNQ